LSSDPVERADLALLIPTLAVRIVTFTSGRTNRLQGVVHVMVFSAWGLAAG
jgi:Ca2+:H+ antiporter